MNKKISLFFLFFSISFVFASFPSYQDFYVNDFADVLNDSDEYYLTNLFSFVEENTGVEIVFVSVDSCSPLTPNEYATGLGEEWGVGKKDLDNGLVLLFCFSENKFYIATGYGLEGVLPDSKIGRYLDEYYVPQRNLQNPSEGIVLFSEVVSEEIYQNYKEGSSLSSKSSFNFLYIFLFIAVILFIFLKFKFFRKSFIFNFLVGVFCFIIGGFLYPSFLGILFFIIGIFFLVSDSSRGYGSSNYRGGHSFGGGGSFGGGSFGGGGAGR